MNATIYCAASTLSDPEFDGLSPATRVGGILGSSISEAVGVWPN